MDWNLKKLWPTVGTSLVAFTSFVNAADDTQMRNLENRVSALEQRKGSNGMINPPARPTVLDAADIFIQGSAFVWQATESGLDYAINFSSPPSGTPANGRFKHPHFKWDWGFKLGIGYNTAHDGWDIFLDWTRFHPERSRSSTSVPGFTAAGFPNAAIAPLFLPNVLDNTIGNSASMDWKLRLDLLDLELGREFFVSKWLTLRPHAGLRSAWIQQRSHLRYNNVNTFSSQEGFEVGVLPLTQVNYAMNLKNNFWGMGLRAGVDGDWCLGGGFSIFNELAVALLLGHFNVNEVINIGPISGLSTTSGSGTVHEKFRATRIAADLQMGLRWHQLFCCERYGLMVQLGWEQHLFVNQNQIQRLDIQSQLAQSGAIAELVPGTPVSVMPITNQGDLSTQGVTLTVQFDF